MNISFLLFWVFTFTINSDSLELPVKNGRVLQNNPGVDKLNKSILIAPTDDIHIRSCLGGKVSIITKDDWGYTVCIKTDSIIMIYSIFDSVEVKLNECVKKGDIIGFKNKFSSDENYIMFSVFILEKEVDAKDYLVKKWAVGQ